MKSVSRFIIFVIAFLALATSAHAQTPREQLNQMAQQLQKTPTDNALREKIIKLARTMKPSPALPDTAVAFEGRAQFAFRSAKSEGDFLAAAQEYEKAVAVAPWVPGYYADLCTIYEKAGKYEDAKRHCGFYLIGLTDLAQMTDVKRRIAGLEFGVEKQKESNQKVANASTSPLEKFEGVWVVAEGVRAAGITLYRVRNVSGVGWKIDDGSASPNEYEVVSVNAYTLVLRRLYQGQGGISVVITERLTLTSENTAISEFSQLQDGRNAGMDQSFSVVRKRF